MPTSEGSAEGGEMVKKTIIHMQTEEIHRLRKELDAREKYKIFHTSKPCWTPQDNLFPPPIYMPSDRFVECHPHKPCNCFYTDWRTCKFGGKLLKKKYRQFVKSRLQKENGFKKIITAVETAVEKALGVVG